MLRAYFSVWKAIGERGEHPSILSRGRGAKILTWVGPHLVGSVNAAVLPWG